MTDNLDTDGRADYGLDAPGVVRNLVMVSVIGFSIFGVAKAHVWSGVIPVPFVANVSIDLSGCGLVLGVLCLVMAAWMVYDSFVGKLALRDRLLAQVAWTGHEEVLDVGCGRGLLLIGAAKRLSSGKAVGIDLWQSEDLTHNQADETLRNARLEGVADRVAIETGDMRNMPFAEGRFDVIVSRAAIHNLYKVAEREAALKEIVRVLKPGGYALISDIRHIDSYATSFTQLGCTVKHSGFRLVPFLVMMLTWGSLRPGFLIARKTV